MGENLDNEKPILAVIIEALLKGGLGVLKESKGQVEEAISPEENLTDQLLRAQDKVEESRNNLESEERNNFDFEVEKKKFEDTDTLKKNSAVELKNQFEKPEIEVEDNSKEAIDDDDEEEDEDLEAEEEERESASQRQRRKNLELKSQLEAQALENEKSESKKSKKKFYLFL